MDRRQQKTRKAIFDALSTLMETNRFEAITVQNIIDQANIGRSTFYSHFETREQLLETMCSDIFYHIFNAELPLEQEHSCGIANLEIKLGHVLYHIAESKNKFKGILSENSGDIFMKYFKSHLPLLFEKYLDVFEYTVPADFFLSYLCSSFAESVKWWLTQGQQYSADEIAEFYIALIPHK